MDWLIEHFVYPTLKIVVIFGAVLVWLLGIMFFVEALKWIFGED